MSVWADLVTTLEPVFANGIHQSVAPAKTPSPYALYQLVSGVPESTMDGATPNLVNSRYQITIFGRDVPELEALVVATTAAMLASPYFKAIWLDTRDLFEDPSVLWGKQVDFSVWNQ